MFRITDLGLHGVMMDAQNLEKFIEEEAFKKVAPIQKARKAIAASPTSWPEPLRETIGKSMRWTIANLQYRNFVLDHPLPMAIPSPCPRHFQSLLNQKQPDGEPIPNDFELSEKPKIIEHKAPTGIVLVWDGQEMAIAIPAGLLKQTKTRPATLVATLNNATKNLKSGDLDAPSLTASEAMEILTADLRVWVLPLVLDQTSRQAKIIYRFQKAHRPDGAPEINYYQPSGLFYEMVGRYIRSIEHHFPANSPAVPGLLPDLHLNYDCTVLHSSSGHVANQTPIAGKAFSILLAQHLTKRGDLNWSQIKELADPPGSLDSTKRSRIREQDPDSEIFVFTGGRDSFVRLHKRFLVSAKDILWEDHLVKTTNGLLEVFDTLAKKTLGKNND